MTGAFLCDAIRTPIGRLNGSLDSIRADDLAIIPIKVVMNRNSGDDCSVVDDKTLAASASAAV